MSIILWKCLRANINLNILFPLVPSPPPLPLATQPPPSSGWWMRATEWAWHFAASNLVRFLLQRTRRWFERRFLRAQRRENSTQSSRFGQRQTFRPASRGKSAQFYYSYKWTTLKCLHCKQSDEPYAFSVYTSPIRKSSLRRLDPRARKAMSRRIGKAW